MLNNLAKEIHENNVKKGFYENEKNIGEMLCLIHSEVSEALECDRKGKYCNYYPLLEFTHEDEMKADFETRIKDTFEDEMADIIIRVLDLCAFKEIDIESHIKAKMRYNSTREFKHGKKY